MPPLPLTPQPDPILSGALHFKVFVTTRMQETIRVPCWCAVACEHSYAEWEAAGRPNMFGNGADDA